MTAILEIVLSALVAIGTIAMAITTMLVIKQNRRHHRDSLRPICVLVPQGGVDQPQLRSGLVRASPEQTARPNEGVFAIHCQVKNIGSGPAMNLKLSIRFMEREGYGPSRELSPLGAGEVYGQPFIPTFVTMSLNHEFNARNYAMATNTAWAIVLEYQDLFGATFHTVHKKNPQEPWTTCGKGLPPSGLVPVAQPVATDSN